jgi:endonuclease YncB( thermonuclease family)
LFEARGQEAASPCGIGALSGGRVAAITDGRSFVLDDGRAIRLAGLEVPPETEPAGQGARGALSAMLVGEFIELRGAADSSDRYGRVVAHAFLADRPVAHEMLAAGHARVGVQAGAPACAAELLSHERVARTARRGLWADPRYAILDAGNLADLVGIQGHFAVVEGKVVSVRDGGGTTYVNFGRRWSQSLTVTISKRHGRIFAAAGIQPAALENRRVRVRGWIEVRSGPRIEANRPEQIEVAELN